MTEPGGSIVSVICRPGPIAVHVLMGKIRAILHVGDSSLFWKTVNLKLVNSNLIVDIWKK